MMARGRKVKQIGQEEGTMDEENGSHLVRPTVGTPGGGWRDERRERGRMGEGD